MIAAIAWASFSVYRSVCLYLFLQVTHKVFQKVGLFETFKIPMDKFLNFFFTLENGYHKIPCKYHVFLSFFPVPYSDQYPAMAWHVYMVFKRVLIINLSELTPRGDQSSYKENSTVNPISPSIKIQIPIWCPYTFPIKVVTRSCWSINSLYLVWSSPWFSSPICHKTLISQGQFWYWSPLGVKGDTSQCCC